MKIILLGGQGSGKGTQAKLLSEEFGIPHISTGDMFRNHIANKTPIGLKVKALSDMGTLCPEDITIQMLLERIQEPDTANGFILDGYPRTLRQAKELDDFLLDNLEIDDTDTLAIALKISDELALSRILKRGKEEHRADDTHEDIVRHRLSQYHANSKSILDFYNEQGILHVIHADEHDTPDMVYKKIKEAVS